MTSNIEIVKSYLAGERPYLTVQGGVDSKEFKATRKVGEIWTDEKGFTYEQKQGYIVKSTRMGNLIRETMGDKKCSCCDKDIKWSNNRFDEKFYNLTDQCFDCTVEYETELRIKGLYKDYENKKIILNQKNYLEDVITQLVEAASYLETEKNLTFVNQTGLVEEWPNVVRKQTLKAVKKDLKKANQYLAEANERLSKLEHVQLKRPRK